MTGKTTIDLLPEGTPTDQGQLVFNEGGLDQKVTKEDFFATEGFGTASKLDAQTSATDATADRVLKVGAFGLGGGAAQGSDFDALIGETTRIQSIFDTSQLAGTRNVLHMSSENNGTQSEIAPRSNGIDIHWRGILSGVPTPWRSIYHNANILGNVSQSGGVPTGAIIERGSNTNGEYTKFADGTMICVAYTTVTNPACTPTGGGYQLAALFSITFPAPFIALTYKSTSTAEYISGINRSWVANGPKSSGNRQAILFAFGDLSTTTTRVETIAIGRWF